MQEWELTVFQRRGKAMVPKSKVALVGVIPCRTANIFKLFVYVHCLAKVVII